MLPPLCRQLLLCLMWCVSLQLRCCMSLFLCLSWCVYVRGLCRIIP